MDETSESFVHGSLVLQNNIFEKFRFNYYSSLQHFYNLIVRQIFEFVPDENTILQASLN